MIIQLEVTNIQAESIQADRSKKIWQFIINGEARAQ